MKKIIAIIPVRYESLRFLGKPMIQYVYETAKNRGIFRCYYKYTRERRK